MLSLSWRNPLWRKALAVSRSVRLNRWSKSSNAKLSAKQKNAQPLPKVRFQNPRLAALGVEVMSMMELRAKVPARRLCKPERVDFFILLFIETGSGAHTLDFIDIPLSAGHLLFVRPGQVQQWHAEDGFEAQLILIDPGALPNSSSQNDSHELLLLGLDEWASGVQLDGENRAIVQAGFHQLKKDFEQFNGSALDVVLIRHQLMTILTRYARLQKQQQDAATVPPGNRQIYRLFIQLLESGFAKERGLQYYAKRLGYSESTVSRACMAAEGRSAKEVISRRVALEAKRLLAHSSASTAEIAHQLGFSEPTNFVKFFRRNTEVTPSDFRRRMQGIALWAI